MIRKTGLKWAKIHKLFVDKEEFLYQLNLKNADTIHPPTSKGSDQGFINALYKYERLELGMEDNVLMNYVLDPKYTAH